VVIAYSAFEEDLFELEKIVLFWVMPRFKNKMKAGKLKFQSIRHKSLLDRREQGTVPGRQGEGQTSGLIPGSFQRDKRPIPLATKEKLRAVGEVREKPRSRQTAPRVIQSTTPETTQHQRNIIQNDAPSLNGLKEKQVSIKREDSRSVGANQAPKYLPLTESGSGYRTGRRSRLDCGDESAQGTCV
jgi:hypothetical protein